MTFGEKIQKLRKEAGLSQEELSYQLGVSRQAISKWERDNGYPETEKIVRMSKIFNVTLDYLLNEEGTQAPETAAEQGIYVSREMADGFLLYQKRKYLKIAIAVGNLMNQVTPDEEGFLSAEQEPDCELRVYSAVGEVTDDGASQ